MTPSRIRENFDVFDFSLDADDLAKIAALDRKDGRIGRWQGGVTFARLLEKAGLPNGLRVLAHRSNRQLISDAVIDAQAYSTDGKVVTPAVQTYLAGRSRQAH